MTLVAITREVSPSLERCELTHREQEPIDLALAMDQHRAYERALEALGCRLFRLPGSPDLPDCVFIEDIAVVLDEVAILTRPGAAARRPETPVVGATLETLRPLAEIREPGTLDGGDVLVAGRTLFVGLSTRTNGEGIEQLGRLAEPLGYRVQPAEVDACLHLKSAVTRIAERTLLIQPKWVDAALFEGWQLIKVAPSEPHAANALRVGHAVLYASAYPRTRARIEARGLRVLAVDQSELAKAEGGVTCCSLIFEGQRRRG